MAKVYRITSNSNKELLQVLQKMYLDGKIAFLDDSTVKCYEDCEKLEQLGAREVPLPA